MAHGDRPLFFYDLGSPYAYLAAERVNALFAETRGEPPEWQPILLGGLFKRFGRDSWARGEGRDQGMREVERRAAAYAKEIGRGVSFSLAAFRQAFAAGRDLTERDNVLLAAAAAEMHPRAVL